MASTLVEFSNGLADAVERAGRAVVAVEEGGRRGVSGVVWREGLAVTAEHTVRGQEEVTIVLGSGEKTKGAVIGRDPSSDIAVLKLEHAATVAEFADPAELKAGHIVLVVGRRGTEGLATSYGVVSATGGAWRTWQGGKLDYRFRLDVNPYPGFSGGPLVNAAGRVLGINTSGPRGRVLTIPRSNVDRVVAQVLQHGRVKRGFIGIGVQPVTLTAGLRSSLGLRSDRGLLVVTVAPGSPAEKAGALVGDVIIEVEGAEAAGASDLLDILEPENVGKNARLRVLRGGKATDITLTVGERAGRD